MAKKVAETKQPEVKTKKDASVYAPKKGKLAASRFGVTLKKSQKIMLANRSTNKGAFVKSWLKASVELATNKRGAKDLFAHLPE